MYQRKGPEADVRRAAARTSSIPQSEGLTPDIVRGFDFESISAMVSSGLGLGFFVEMAPRMMRTGLTSRPVKGLVDTIPIFLVHRENPQNKSITHFRNALRQYQSDPAAPGRNA